MPVSFTIFSKILDPWSPKTYAPSPWQHEWLYLHVILKCKYRQTQHQAFYGLFCEPRYKERVFQIPLPLPHGVKCPPPQHQPDVKFPPPQAHQLVTSMFYLIDTQHRTEVIVIEPCKGSFSAESRSKTQSSRTCCSTPKHRVTKRQGRFGRNTKK